VAEKEEPMAAKPTTKPAARRGTAGRRGPVPKRSTERRRRNKESTPDVVQINGAVVAMPPVNDAWHEIARDWYLSLAESGQSQFYEPSDWQAARYVAEVMSRNLKQGKKFSSMLFSAVWAGMGDLLTTEADRRRVRMEIERVPNGDGKPAAGVTAIADYRARLKKPKSAAGG
jgi:hypothetical protein